MGAAHTNPHHESTKAFRRLEDDPTPQQAFRWLADLQDWRPIPLISVSYRGRQGSPCDPRELEILVSPESLPHWCEALGFTREDMAVSDLIGDVHGLRFRRSSVSLGGVQIVAFVDRSK